MSEIAPASSFSPKSARVMVVDDERCIRATIYELLASEGINVLKAGGSDDCLLLLRDGFRGVILMDVMMPVRNGWDTIREIKKEGLMEGNIILMLTAMDIPDERMEGLQEFVIDYITKPFDSNELIAAVHRYLALLDGPTGE